ncbi:hypothetical protein PPACK8108_LOCUS4922 [Phakopsora pachyrhizi]|uniref:EF-hand domain-containing protein n=1 Tax=Phakopsora pachyrhizi TaxID=170000 RepID=A0AAV0AMS5_PHAPC|nr:hypothetical protein PPACK8108_LOCUS4922 [Phakopsora pachyrhizi]
MVLFSLELPKDDKELSSLAAPPELVGRAAEDRVPRHFLLKSDQRVIGESVELLTSLGSNGYGFRVESDSKGNLEVDHQAYWLGVPLNPGVLRRSGYTILERLERREESYRNVTEILRKPTSSLPNPFQIELNNINLINGIKSDEEKNKEDFINYMISLRDRSDEDRLITDEEFLEYCDWMARTAEWAGKPEIMALSRHCKKMVQGIQAVGTIFESLKPDQ